MHNSVTRWVGAAAAASLIMSASVATASPVPAPAPAPAQINPWQALSILNGGTSVIAYSGAAAAAQPVLPQVDSPPPPAQPQPPIIDEPLPPPLPGAAAPFSVSPLVLALGALALAALAYLLLKKGGGSNSPN